MSHDEQLATGWIQTFTGRQFWPLRPLAKDVDLHDIAHALSMKCRYNGHSNRYYSVAEHSVRVSRMVPPAHAAAALFHDAAEAYLPDVPRPIKAALIGFDRIEADVEAAIARKFGLAWPWHDEIKRADTTILADEKAVLMPDEPADWHLPYPPAGVTIECWSPQQAYVEFLVRAEDVLG